MCLAQGQNKVMPLRIKLATSQSLDTNSTTEPLRSLTICKFKCILFIELTENHLDVWKSKLFIQKTLADHLLPISHYMDRKGGLKLQKSLYAVGKIAKCLDFLHTRDMSPLNFTLDNIYVKQNGKVCLLL